MNPCRESSRIQEWLDGDLAGRAAADFSAHLADCPHCLAELAGYRRLFAVLERERHAVADPGPALTERILDRVLPSRLRQRWVTAFGWVYGTASAASTFAFVSWIAQPSTPVWLTQRLTEATLVVSQVLGISLQVLMRSLLEILNGWAFLGAVAERMAPLGRALMRPLADPTLAAVLLAATLACAGMIWWMRPGRRSTTEGMGNVGLLAF